jgi:hypothetical protein
MISAYTQRKLAQHLSVNGVGGVPHTGSFRDLPFVQFLHTNWFVGLQQLLLEPGCFGTRSNTVVAPVGTQILQILNVGALEGCMRFPARHLHQAITMPYATGMT